MVRKYTKGQGTQLSPYFTSREFDCKCTREDCRDTYIHELLVRGLTEHRKQTGKPVRILSGFRCREHNKEIGGEENSWHCLGFAADIQSEDPATTLFQLEYFHCFRNGGLGLYPKRGFVHADVRGKRARWRS